MNNPKRVRKDFLIALFKENTGQHFLDSGGANGRQWQRNQKRDFTIEPEYTIALDEWGKGTDHHRVEVNYTASMYRNLVQSLGEDSLTRTFNRKFRTMKDWDGGGYGISLAAEEWLNNRDAKLGESFNTYNYTYNFDANIQYTKVKGIESKKGYYYILMQVHGGADIRGGYTDAKMFAVLDEDNFLNQPWGSFTVERDGKRFGVGYIPGEGMSLDDDNNSPYVPMIGDKIID